MAQRLNGSKKAAILLLALGEESAAEIIKNLSPEEIEQVTASINQFDEVSPADVERVANEFYLIAEKGKFLPASPETKTAYLKKVLSKGMGEDSASQILEGIIEENSGGELEKLKWHDPSTIAEFLGGEHPQVIAVILGNLGDFRLTKEVIEELPAGIREDVMARLARLREISQEWIEEIEQSLAQELNPQIREEDPENTGIDKVSDVLNAASPRVEQDMIHSISQRNPKVAERIKDRMFPFEDFIKLDNFSLQKVLEKVTNEDLVLALRTSNENLKRHFFRNLSDDNVRQLEEAIGNFQPTRISSIEDAQKRLCQVARELTLKGEIRTLERKR